MMSVGNVVEVGEQHRGVIQCPRASGMCPRETSIGLDKEQGRLKPMMEPTGVREYSHVVVDV
jgi:hypothetical protein